MNLTKYKFLLLLFLSVVLPDFFQAKADIEEFNEKISENYTEIIGQYPFQERRNDIGIFYDFAWDKNNKKIIISRDDQNLPIIRFSLFNKDIQQGVSIKKYNDIFLAQTSDEEISMWKNNLAKKFIESVPLDIYVAKNDGSDKQRLTSNGATNWAPSWHPDGKHIVFSSNMDDWREDYNAYGSNFELYMINIATKTLTRLTNNDTFDSFPVFSKNGKKIVFSSNRDAENPRNTNIFIADIVYK